MKTLDTEFTFRGFNYKQLVREGKIALYRASKGEINIHWEVVRIRVMPEHKFPDGKMVPEREAMPSDEEWGSNGFTYRCETKAFERFRSMAAGDAEKALQQNMMEQCGGVQ